MLGCSLVAHRWAPAIGAVVAILSLVLDLVLAVRLNVPINKRMNGWSLASIPDDWQDQRVLYSSCSGREEVTRGVEEDRRSKTQRVDAVHHAAVPFDHRAPVFDASVALDGAHGEPS